MEVGVDSKQGSQEVTVTVHVRTEETFQQSNGRVIVHKVKKTQEVKSKELDDDLDMETEDSMESFKPGQKAPTGKVRVHQDEAKCTYLSSAIDIIRVSLLTLHQCHMGEVLHWIRKRQEHLALLGNTKSLS